MFSEKIPLPRLYLWVMIALSGPLAQLAGVTSWLTVAVTAVVCGFLCAAVLRPQNKTSSRWMCVAQLFWLAVFVGQLAAKSAGSWDEGNTYPIVPLILLLLAALSAKSGGEKASRAITAVVWLVALMFALVLGAGTTMIRGENLLPVWQKPSWELAALLLIPAVSAFLPSESKTKIRWLPAFTGAFAVIVNLWVIGCMSRELAAYEKGAFLEYSKSISLFGVAERFEAVVSCALTVGWFALLSLLFAAAGHQAEQISGQMGSWGVWICLLIAAVSVLLRWQLPDWVVAGLALILWVILPVCQGVCLRRKKLKKDKNSS